MFQLIKLRKPFWIRDWVMWRKRSIEEQRRDYCRRNYRDSDSVSVFHADTLLKSEKISNHNCAGGASGRRSTLHVGGLLLSACAVVPAWRRHLGRLRRGNQCPCDPGKTTWGYSAYLARSHRRCGHGWADRAKRYYGVYPGKQHKRKIPPGMSGRGSLIGSCCRMGTAKAKLAMRVKRNQDSRPAARKHSALAVISSSLIIPEGSSCQKTECRLSGWLSVPARMIGGCGSAFPDGSSRIARIRT